MAERLIDAEEFIQWCEERAEGARESSGSLLLTIKSRERNDAAAIAYLNVARHAREMAKASAPDERHAEGRQTADDPTADAEETGSGEGRDNAAATCPACGSDDPAICHNTPPSLRPKITPHPHDPTGIVRCCTDPFHTPTTREVGPRVPDHRDHPERVDFSFTADDAAALFNLAAMFFPCEYGATQTIHHEIEVRHEDCICDCCNLRRWFWQRGMKRNPLLDGKPFAALEASGGGTVSPVSDRVKLTDAQREALEVLACQDKPIGGWKLRTERGGADTGPPRVNYRAVDRLVALGFVRRHWSQRFNPYSHTDTYSITDEGRRAL